MRIYRLAYAALVAATVSFLLATFPARAEYPDHAVRVMVPFPPAGGADATARVIATALGEELHQSFVVENHPGASGRIGTELVAKAPPDGYTLLLGSVGPNAIIPGAYRDLPYDAVKSFAPISIIGNSAYALVVPASLPAKSVAELVALAKASPGKLNFASTGNLGGPHLAGELLKLLTGIDVVHVPYKGGGPMVAALLGGQVSFAFASLPTIAAHVKAGTLRVLAVTGDSRAGTMPDVPTMSETIPGYRVVQWYGILAPAGTPVPVVTRLNAAMAKVLSDPKVKDTLVRLDTEPAPTSPQAFASEIAHEVDDYRNLVAKAGIKAD